MTPSLTIYSPAGVVKDAAVLRRAVKHLNGMGFAAALDESALAKQQRFAGDDETRLAALHRVADQGPAVALAARGGYGLTRLLPAIDWKRVARSVERGTQWVGHSDLTALQLGLLAQARGCGVTWAGPLGVEFGAAEVDDITEACFGEAMREELEAIGFRTADGHAGFEAEGLLWGGNLTVLCSLLGTPWFPKIRGGILFVEDVAEHPYRVERMLLQLQQAGVLDAQKAVLVGDFTDWKKSPNDRGYNLKAALAAVQSSTRARLLPGLPFGHGVTKVCLPVGAKAQVVVDGRNAFVAWGHV